MQIKYLKILIVLILIISFAEIKSEVTNSFGVHNYFLGPKISYTLLESVLEKNVENIKLEENLSFSNGLSFGAFHSFDFYGNWGFRNELMFSFVQKTLDFETKGVNHVKTSNKHNALFLDIPLVLLYKIPLESKFALRLHLGLSPSIVLSESNSLEAIKAQEGTADYLAIEDYLDHDMINFKTKIGAELEYNRFVFEVNFSEDFLGLDKTSRYELGVEFGLSYKLDFSKPQKVKQTTVAKPRLSLKDILKSDEFEIDYQNKLIKKVRYDYTGQEILDKIYSLNGSKIVLGENANKEEIVVLKRGEGEEDMFRVVRSDIQLKYIISSDKFIIDYENKSISKIDYHVYKETFLKGFKVANGFKIGLADIQKKEKRNYGIMKSTDQLLLFDRKGVLINKYSLVVNPPQLASQETETTLKLNDEVIKQTKFKKTLVKDIEKELIRSDNVSLRALAPDSTVLNSEDILLDKSIIKLLNKENYQPIKEFSFRTRYFIPKEGEEISILDTIELKKGEDVNVVLENIMYKVGTNEFKEIAFGDLKKLNKLMSMFPNIKIKITSHSSYDGDEKANMQLSEKRAIAVVNYLTENGIDKSRLDFHGAGESQAVKVSKEKANLYKFLKEGTVLDEAYITKNLKGEEAKIARSLSRRTEIEIEN
jgi:outer membrane protein OmpA-like peptidoglycan-associated protein